MDRLASQCAGVQRRVDTADREVIQSWSELEGLRLGRDNLLGQVEETRNLYTKMENRYETTVHSLRSEIHDLKSQLATLNFSYTDLKVDKETKEKVVEFRRVLAIHFGFTRSPTAIICSSPSL